MRQITLAVTGQTEPNRTDAEAATATLHDACRPGHCVPLLDYGHCPASQPDASMPRHCPTCRCGSQP